MVGPPSRLLLASDLSARCDRALDRAVQLAGQWSAELVVLTVLEGPQAPDQAFLPDSERQRMAQRQLEIELADAAVPVRFHIAQGEPASAIRGLAAAENVGLIVTGMARNETFGRFLVGTTVDHLARAATQPLLVVRTRARKAYQHVVVATDFSDSSRHALQAAARFFPEREVTLYHAYTLPLSGLADEASHERTSRDIERGECAAFLAGSDLPAQARGRLRVVIEHGAPETALTRFVREQDVDLTVLGTHGRTGLKNVVLGSVAARLLNWLPCDTMIVRQPRAPA